MKKETGTQGAAVLLISTAAVKLIGAVFKIPLANILKDEGFGLFSLVYDLFTPFYALAMTGLPVAVSKLYAGMPHKMELRANLFYISKRFFYLLGLLFTAAFCLLVPVFMQIVGSDFAAIFSLAFVALAIMLFFPISVYRGWFEGHNNMFPTAVSDLIEAVCKLFLGLGFAVASVRIGKSYETAAAAALFGIVLGVAAAWVWIFIYSRHRIPRISENCINTADLKHKLFNSTVSIGIAAVMMSVPATLIDALTVRPLLAEISEISEAAQALYGVRGRAFTIFNLVPSVTAAIGISFIPRISEAFAKKDIIKLRSRACLAFKLAMCVSLPAGLGLSMLSNGIFRLLYSSSEFCDIGSGLLVIYGIAAVFAGMSIPLLQMLQAIGKQGMVLLILFGAALIKLLGNLILIPVFNINIYGAAISTLMLYFFAFICGLIISLKKIGGMSINLLLRTVAAVAISLLTAKIISLLFSGNMGILLSIGAAVIVFLAAVIFLHVFSSEEAEVLFGRKCFRNLINSRKYM